MTSKKKQIRNSALLILTALIWGVAFVAQSQGGDAVGPYTFNCVRSLLGGMVLLPVIAFLDRLGFTSRRPENREDRKRLFTGGVICGIALFAASTLQQLGITYGSSVGKAGFLTACYILIVPIMGIFLGRKCGWNIWCGVVMALAGLFLLCLKDGFSAIQVSDMLLLLCALFYSIQIMAVDHYSPLVDGVRLSCIQFFVSGLIGLIPMICGEMVPLGWIQWAQSLASWSAWIPILYAGILSCGVAYTLQIVGQDGLNPTVASLLMSLESVFSVLAGAVILKQYLSGREMIGCAFIFAAIVLAQIDFKRFTGNQ